MPRHDGVDRQAIASPRRDVWQRAATNMSCFLLTDSTGLLVGWGSNMESISNRASRIKTIKISHSAVLTITISAINLDTDFMDGRLDQV